MPVGINKFILQADAPDPSTIPSTDILGVTVILVTCSYREEEFVRVGYYVNNEYTMEEAEITEEGQAERTPPMPLDMTKVVRTILADKPRVTRWVRNHFSPPLSFFFFFESHDFIQVLYIILYPTYGSQTHLLTCPLFSHLLL